MSLALLLVMQRYIALLSGLPVGSHKVDMEILANLFRKLGFLNVETYLTTGNVAFDTAPVGIVPPLEAQISRHLTRSIGGDIRTFIRTHEQIAEIIANVPFDVKELSGGRTSVFVVFVDEALDERTALRLRVRRNDSDVLHPAGREIYWLRRTTDDASSRPMSISELLDVPATLRSLGSLAKIAGQSARHYRVQITESERSHQ